MSDATAASRRASPRRTGEYAEDARGAEAMRRLPAAGVLAVALAGFCCFLDLYATQPLLPLLESVFHASKAAAGATVSAGTIAVALGAPVIGLFADRVTRKRLIVAALFALVIPTALAATSRGLGELVAWRFLQGLAVPAVYVSLIAYITEEAGAASVGIVMAGFVTGNVLGGLSGRAIAGVVASHGGWRRAFVVLSALNLVGAAATWRWLLPSRHFTPHPGGGLGIRERSVALSDERLLATYAIAFCMLFALVATFSYITFHLAAPPFGLGPAALGGVFLVYLVGAAITPAAGRWIDRAGSRIVLTAAASVGVVGIILTLAHSLPLVIGGLALCGSAAFMSQSAAASYLRIASPPAARSLASGVYVTCYYLGGSIGGILPGFLWERAGWGGCVALVIVAQLVIATMAWRWWERRDR
ncbi:MAG TPA: MFS transporter [Gemmatimonadaceae bacterium]